MGRGGAFRSSVRLLPQEELDAAIDSVVRKGPKDVLEFGQYDRLTRSQAASAEGLHHNKVLLKTLIGLCPGAEVQHHQLKHSLLQFPRMNDTAMKDDLWAAQKAERILTMLCHIRRIARDDHRYRQCLTRATRMEQEAVNLLVSMTDIREPSVQRSKARSTSPSKSIMSSPPSKKRALKSHVSEASSALSLDADGFPSMLTDMICDARGDRDLHSAEIETKCYEDMSRPSSNAANSFGGDSRHAFDKALAAAALHAAETLARVPMKKPAALTTTPKTALRKRPAGVVLKTSSSMTDKYTVTKASQKSYIQVKHGSKKTLLVNCTEQMAAKYGKHHADVIQHVHLKLATEEITREDAIACRDAFLTS